MTGIRSAVATDSKPAWTPPPTAPSMPRRSTSDWSGWTWSRASTRRSAPATRAAPSRTGATGTPGVPGFPVAPEPELLNAMAPGNWDAPHLISPHDANTLYAGTNKLWKSTDRGDTWTDLGDLTTRVNRRELLIMGQRAGDSTQSLDDGIPYYPTLRALAESPLQRGLLYAGTDDGNLQVSRDDGKTWTNVADRIPGLPRTSWIAGIEPSRFDAGTVYVTADNHRSNDYRNYLFKSTDLGQSWLAIVSDLPANRVLRTVREDPRNRNVL